MPGFEDRSVVHAACLPMLIATSRRRPQQVRPDILPAVFIAAFLSLQLII